MNWLRRSTAQSKGRRLAKSNPWPTVLACLILLAALSLAFGLGAMLATAGREDRPPQEATVPATSNEPSAAPAETPEPVRHRDNIVSEGRLLAYDLQETMQDCCERYGVPYALALAIAEVETHFDPDAVSPPHDYGLMQINQVNHEWLQGLGMDPLTHAGNIEAGLYLISDYLSQYGDTEMALMAYNNGPTGARKLWDAGVYQTDYTRKVMTALEHWTSVLEDRPMPYFTTCPYCGAHLDPCELCDCQSENKEDYINDGNENQALLVLTERHTRMGLVILVEDHTAASVVKAINGLERHFGKLFYKIFKSITVDNGCEFQDFEGIEMAHRRKGKRTVVFFCHPYSAYERGSNENMNRLIRRFFPKGTNFDNVTKEQVTEAERWMNHYPRKLLGWKSAAMLFKEELQAA